MKVLALEPYYGGSHRAFLDGWIQQSRHEWTVLGLRAYKWKWRMRHAAITLARQVDQYVRDGCRWDVVFCSDMLNLAEFLGLVDQVVGSVPVVAYFHENQLTYPVRCEDERDYQFAMTNLTTAIAADRVWFNSSFHRDSFLDALTGLLKRMPDYQPFEVIDEIRAKSQVRYQGIAEFTERDARRDGEIRILWAARWEHDKNPEAFFEALKILDQTGVDFRVSVIGQRFRDAPEVFAWAQTHFGRHIDLWGYQSSRQEYLRALYNADVIVSTADHEFFGVTVVEAIAAGAWPVLPRRLAYPEIMGDARCSEDFFYDGTVTGLVERLTDLAVRVRGCGLWGHDPQRAVRAVDRFYWPRLAKLFDAALEDFVQS